MRKLATNRLSKPLVMVLLVAGCSSATSPGTIQSQPGTSLETTRPTGQVGGSTITSGATNGGNVPTTQQFISAAEASRLAAEANQGVQFGGEEFGLSERQLVERSDSVEALIGQCMADAGFEYFPVEFSTIERAMSSDKSAPGMSNRMFVAEYGFGITTQYEKPIVALSLGKKNLRVIDSLGDADQVAYYRTLLGEFEDATYAYGLETEDFSRTGGCTRQAVEQLFSEAEMSPSYFNPGDAIIATDPRAVQAIADWHVCMVEGGIDAYEHPDDVETDFQRRLDALTQGADPQELTGAKLEALEQLQAEERFVAGVFTDCENNVLDPVMNRVEADYYGR